MKSRKQELSEKADVERRRCQDWLLRFVRDGQPKVLTKAELREAAMRDLKISKTRSTLPGSGSSRKPVATIGTSHCGAGIGRGAKCFPVVAPQAPYRDSGLVQYLFCDMISRKVKFLALFDFF